MQIDKDNHKSIHNIKFDDNIYKLMDKSFLQNIRKYWIEL